MIYSRGRALKTCLSCEKTILNGSLETLATAHSHRRSKMNSLAMEANNEDGSLRFRVSVERDEEIYVFLM